MELDPDDVFRDEDEDPESEFFREKEASKEFVVYLIDASPKMFSSTCASEHDKQESHFHIAVSCIAQSLKSHIINRSSDEIAICFFNTREKKNLQDLNGVYVYNVPERDCIDRPTARMIKDFDRIQESFIKDIGSQNGIVSDSRENSLYSALWVAQALLRKGSSKTADKRIFLFTNEDDPFGSMRVSVKEDMTRTTLQRAKPTASSRSPSLFLDHSLPHSRIYVSKQHHLYLHLNLYSRLGNVLFPFVRLCCIVIADGAAAEIDEHPFKRITSFLLGNEQEEAEIERLMVMATPNHHNRLPLRERRKRWVGGHFKALSCFGSNKGERRIVPTSQMSEGKMKAVQP